MPRPFLIVGALLALSLAACNSKNYLSAISPAAPTASPTTAPTYNPSITTATVEVTASASPVPNVTVSLCTSNGCANGANQLQQMTTNAQGEVTFAALTPGTVYCFVNVVTGTGSTTTYQLCTSYWQSSSAVAPLKIGN